MKSNNFILPLIIIFSISSVAYVLLSSVSIKAKDFGDNDFFLESKAISSWMHNVSDGKDIKITKAPGPTIFYVLPCFLSGKNASSSTILFASRIWNFIWISISMILLFTTVEMTLKDSKSGYLILLLLLFIPLQYYYAMGMLAETMAFSGICMFIYGIIALFEKPKLKKIAVTFTIFGILFMITARPNSALFFILFILTLIYLRKKVNLSLKIFMELVLITLTSIILVLAIFFGTKLLPAYATNNNQSSYFLYVVHQGRFQFRNEPWDWRFWDNAIRSDSKDYQMWCNSSKELQKIANNKKENVSTEYKNWIIDDIKENKLIFVKQFFIKILFGNFLQINSTDRNHFKIGPLHGIKAFYIFLILLNFINVIITIFSIWGMYIFIRKKKYLILITTPLISLLLFHSLVYMEQRYLYPARPIILLFCSLTFVNLIKKIKKNAARNLNSDTSV